MIIPRINLNGTDIDCLLEEHVLAIRALDTAIAVVTSITVHGRDYQTAALPKEYLRLAMDDRASRLARLLTVRDELEAVAMGIEAQRNRVLA